MSVKKFHICDRCGLTMDTPPDIVISDGKLKYNITATRFIDCVAHTVAVDLCPRCVSVFEDFMGRKD